MSIKANCHRLWDLRTRVYGGQTPITHSLHTLVCLANDIIYTKVFKNPEVNILIIGNHSRSMIYMFKFSIMFSSNFNCELPWLRSVRERNHTGCDWHNGTRFSATIERGCRSFSLRIPINECWSCGLHKSETEHFIWFSQVRLIFGRGGETIKSLQSRSGVRTQVCRRHCIHYAL